ncbi:MAG: hypothetical protein CM15mP47_4820 [Methanobacteriota archaeon]|nr:MAG: hypothetical protein CM15mP47_4820 [Euryarchaeota archaeon]
MLPDKALDRLQDGCKFIADRCNSLGLESWEVVAAQSYGHQIDIEGGKISLAAEEVKVALALEWLKMASLVLLTWWMSNLQTRQ